jgi:hypothetical protein
MTSRTFGRGDNLKFFDFEERLAQEKFGDKLENEKIAEHSEGW